MLVYWSDLYSKQESAVYYFPYEDVGHKEIVSYVVAFNIITNINSQMFEQEPDASKKKKDKAE